MNAQTSDDLILDVKNLKTVFFTNSGLFKAVDDVSFHVRRGETLAIVGESGCGKSVSALSIMRLVPNPPGKIVGGSVTLEGTDLLTLDEDRMRAIRGNRMSMIFQEPTRCCASFASPSRNGARGSIRTNCPAACASAP